MTRTEFRSAVEAPRPAAAWMMSGVASAALWITEQLPLWIILVQIAAYAVSLATRHRPPAFRSSPVWLNIFMAGITTVTVRSALAGNPATISLAYFTSLAQGLQLLDARPRKSEFVLVALALFQVILASNLTDSVLFPPLLIAFLASVTWTLLVHTLAMESAEAGDPAALDRLVAPDLRRMTVIATCASLVLAGLLFIAMPRLKANVLRGGVGSGMALSGFSEQVALGDVGRIRKDHSVVLRVESVEGPLPNPSDAYWRGLAFDTFDGQQWAISRSKRVAARRPVSGVGRFGIELSPSTGAPTQTQRILREPVKSGVVFLPGTLERIEGPFQRVELDRNGGLYLPGRGDDRIRYTVRTRPSERNADRLRRDRIALPLEPSAGGQKPARRYLQLPPLDERIAARAAAIVADQETDFDRVHALRNALRESGRYTDTPPAISEGARSPIEAFLLGDLEGHCEYFASAMVVLARTQGIPSRLVNGFAGGVPNEVGGFIEVTQADAHAWVEVYFEKAGWVRFDPTPPTLRLRDDGTASLWAQIGQVGSAIELWWFQRVVDFDSADQISAARGLFAGFRGRDDGSEAAPESPDSPAAWTAWNPFTALDPWVLFGGFGLVLAAVAWFQTRPDAAEQALPESYRQARRILARAGLARSETTSARAFAESIQDQLDAEGATAFAKITDHYLAARFGARPSPDLSSEVLALKNAVDRMGLRDEPHVR